jgi:hypothetical protein
MSALGQKQTLPSIKRDVRFTPESGHCRATVGCPLSARSGHRDTPLFDHLVGGDKHRLRNCQAQRFSGFEVDGELDFRGLLDR